MLILVAKSKMRLSMECKFPERRARSTWRKSGAATPVYRATAPASERKVFVAKKGPAFLKVYAFPVLLLNLALLGWDVISAKIWHKVGQSISDMQ